MISRILKILLIFYVLAENIDVSHCLGQDGENVCSKQSLIKVVDVYPLTWSEEWDCESSYPITTCERIRSNEIDINSVYFVKEDLVCCPGWLTSEDDEGECTQSCQEGYYGENCQLTCRCLNGKDPRQCHPVDGSCDCLDGWTGRECDERCSPGYFGPNCGGRSIFTCMNGGINHPVTGLCLCTSGYDGSRCETNCRGNVDCGHLVCGNCLPNSTISCDTIFGACVCLDGWEGRYCAEPCEIGTTGQFCEETCCSGRGYCTGERCICADGYFGDECQQKCERGYFGRSCSKTCDCPSCDHETGDCDLCPFGFTGRRCTERCLPTQWGPSCNLTCSCGKDVACDVFTGECPASGSFLWLLVMVLVVVILLLVGTGYLYFICNRSSKKVQNEDEQMATQNDNYSTMNGYSHYIGFRGIYATDGQPAGAPEQTANRIYNPAYQSFNEHKNTTGMEKGPYNSVYLTPRDCREIKTPIGNNFSNPAYNIEVIKAKQNSPAKQPNELEENHPYEDIRHDYDNAIFSKKS